MAIYCTMIEGGDRLANNMVGVWGVVAHTASPKAPRRSRLVAVAEELDDGALILRFRVHGLTPAQKREVWSVIEAVADAPEPTEADKEE